MPYTWTPETERALLLAAIQEADLKPNKAVWTKVAVTLGGGLTASAVSQKFSKIKNAAMSSGAMPGPATATRKTITARTHGGTVGNSGRKRKRVDYEEATNRTEIKVEDNDETKVEMEGSNEDSSNDIRIPSKKTPTGMRKDTEAMDDTVRKENSVFVEPVGVVGGNKI